MGLQLGDDFEIYWDSADTWATPTWAKVTPADESLEVDWGIIDGAFKKRHAKDVTHKPGQTDPSISFGVFYDKAHAFCDRLRAIEAGTEESIILAIADGDITTAGTEYIKVEVTLKSLSLDAGLDNGAKYDVELGIFEGVNNRTLVVVSA